MKKILYPLSIAAICFVFFAACADDDFWSTIIPETDDDATQKQVSTFVFIPGLMDADDNRVGQLRVPVGFQIEKFAEGLTKPRMMLTNSTGQTYVTSREAGLVYLLEDTTGDGKADRIETVAEIEEAHGLAIRENQLYIVAVKELYVADMAADGSLGAPQLLNGNLPDGGQHPNRTMGFGPDGMLYISIGSTCNSCPEPNPLHATMLRGNPDGTGMQIYAKGLRNTVGFDWHPETGDFWGMDHGIDMLGDEQQMEELNLIAEGGNYGWPYIYDNGRYNPYPRPENMTYQEYSAMTTFPHLLHTAHAAPMAMVFYNGGQFPEDYNGDAFVAFRGSWNRSRPSGYNVGRVRFSNGQPTAIEDFVTGFLVDNNRSHFARPVGLTVMQDGSLLLSEDTNGVVYRIHYVGQ